MKKVRELLEKIREQARNQSKSNCEYIKRSL